jgi:hypothetical protein
MKHKLHEVIAHREVVLERAMQKLIDGEAPPEYVYERRKKLKAVLKPKRRRQ